MVGFAHPIEYLKILADTEMNCPKQTDTRNLGSNTNWIWQFLIIKKQRLTNLGIR